MRLSLLLLLAAFACASTDAGLRAATLTLSQGYDENTNQPNAVDTQAAGNSLTLTSFSTLVSSAFTAGTGGVINFDTPNGGTGNVNSQSSNTVNFGPKSFSFTSASTGGTTPSSNVNVASFGSLTPISGSSADSKGLITTNGTAESWTLNFNSLTGGAVNEAITTMGFTLLSRSGAGQTVQVDWLLNGSSTAAKTQTEAISSTQAGDDTFFSYVAPTGSTITGLRFTFDTLNALTNPDVRLAIDDLAFITSIVPEPSRMAFLGLGIFALFGRRQRPACRVTA